MSLDSGLRRITSDLASVVCSLSRMASSSTNDGLMENLGLYAYSWGIGRCGFSRKCGVRVGAGLNAAEAAPTGREPRIDETDGFSQNIS